MWSHSTVPNAYLPPTLNAGVGLVQTCPNYSLAAVARVYRVGRDAFLQAPLLSKEVFIDPRTARRSEEPVGIQSVRVSDMEDDRVARNRPSWRRRTRSVRALAVPGRLCGREATVWSGCDSIRGTVSVLLLTLRSVEWDVNLAPLALTCKFFFSVLWKVVLRRVHCVS